VFLELNSSSLHFLGELTVNFTADAMFRMVEMPCHPLFHGRVFWHFVILMPLLVDTSSHHNSNLFMMEGVKVKTTISSPVKIMTGCNQKYRVMINCTVIQVITIMPEYSEYVQAQCLFG
jgi:hypothetical protein